MHNLVLDQRPIKLMLQTRLLKEHLKPKILIFKSNLFIEYIILIIFISTWRRERITRTFKSSFLSNSATSRHCFARRKNSVEKDFFRGRINCGFGVFCVLLLSNFLTFLNINNFFNGNSLP